MTTRRLLAIGAIWMAAASLLSCASGMRVYVNPEADLAFYKKIAVLPFTDMSGNSLAGPRVTRAFVTELIMTNRYQIVQPEEFTAALARMRIYPASGAYDPSQLKDVATQMGLTGILRGAVNEYQMTRDGSGEIPVIGFDAELLDVNTGNVVWRSSISRRAKGRLSVVGSGSRSLGRLTQDACVEMVAQLRGKGL
jgi:TolB-like protein